MGWQNLLNSGGNRVLPWLGGNQVHSHDRTWTIKGRTPREFGWYTFDTSGGRTARLKDESEMDPGYEQGQPVVRGFLVGDRLVLDGARVEPDPNKLIEQTEPVFCIERGLGRFVRVAAIRDVEDRLIYMRTEFPLGPEDEVNAAYQDRKDSVSEIPGVTPPLDLAFRWVSYQRAAQEAWEAELARRQAAEAAQLAEQERRRRLLAQVGTSVGRRELALVDFNAAARAALAIGGAEFLDARDGFNRGEKVVEYRFRNRRLECVCDATTLRIITAGVCLSANGVRGDTWFTLESLPTVIAEAMERHQLVVLRGEFDDDRWNE